jgi:hypothetical protein
MVRNVNLETFIASHEVHVLERYSHFKRKYMKEKEYLSSHPPTIHSSIYLPPNYDRAIQKLLCTWVCVLRLQLAISGGNIFDKTVCQILGFYGGDYEEWCLLGRYAVWPL